MCIHYDAGRTCRNANPNRDCVSYTYTNAYANCNTSDARRGWQAFRSWTGDEDRCDHVPEQYRG
jgi:hypothetical protein